MRDKVEIRRDVLKMRRAMNPEEIGRISRAILMRLTECEEWKSAGTVLTYASLPDEVSTFGIIELALSEGRTVAVPKVEGRTMSFHRISSPGDLAPGFRGIPEPLEEHPVEVSEGLMIVPGAAFSVSCDRIGYGGGYYDRYISLHPSLIRAGLAPDAFIFEALPVEEHDVPMDMLITESRVLRS